MIYKVFPSVSDFENLSRLATESCPEVAACDYSSVVVNKPWGYEYLWLQTESVAAWMLHLKAGSSTSLHCHVRKRTSLIVIEGNVVCSTLEDRFRLSSLDAMVLEAGVFHGTLATSVGGAFVLEIETPVMKHDLVRLKDSFGRQGTGYETVAHHSSDFANYEYKPFVASAGSRLLQFRQVQFCLVDGKSSSNDFAHLSKTGLIIPTRKPLRRQKLILADVAEAISMSRIAATAPTELAAGVELLHIQPRIN